jgi:hypothetical protein
MPRSHSRLAWQGLARALAEPVRHSPMLAPPEPFYSRDKLAAMAENTDISIVALRTESASR